MMRFAVLALAALFLTGCAGFVLVPPGKQTLRDGVSVETPIAWSEIRDDRIILWTVNGPALETLVFHTGVEPDRALFAMVNERSNIFFDAGLIKRPDFVPPKWRPGMTEPEIADLYVQTHAVQFNRRVEMTRLGPADFAGHPGFRFDYIAVGNDGVRRTGFVTGAEIQGKLYLVDYRGTSLYHFDRLKAEAERIVASLKVEGR